MINNREAIPCDVLIVGVDEPAPQTPAGISYVETKSLDGETNLKIRQVLYDEFLPKLKFGRATPMASCHARARLSTEKRAGQSDGSVYGLCVLQDNAGGLVLRDSSRYRSALICSTFKQMTLITPLRSDALMIRVPRGRMKQKK